MTVTLKPWHLAGIAFLVGLLLTTVIVLAVSGGSGGPAQAVVVVTATRETSTLSTSDSIATATAVPPMSVPPPSAPSPEAQPIRTCAEIRAAGTYLNDVERDFFLASCQITGGGPAAAPSSAPAPAVPTTVPAAPPASDPAIAEAERSYRGRAEGVVGAWLTRFRQLPRVIGSRAALFDYGATAGGWANQMDNLAPVPLRFQRAHDQLQAALRALDAHTHVEPLVFSSQYLNKLNSLILAVNGALDDYALVVGLAVPPPAQ